MLTKMTTPVVAISRIKESNREKLFQTIFARLIEQISQKAIRNRIDAKHDNAPDDAPQSWVSPKASRQMLTVRMKSDAATRD